MAAPSRRLCGWRGYWLAALLWPQAVGADVAPVTVDPSEHCRFVGTPCHYAGGAIDRAGICERAEDCSITPDPTLCLICVEEQVAARKSGCAAGGGVGGGWAGGAALALLFALVWRGRIGPPLPPRG